MAIATYYKLASYLWKARPFPLEKPIVLQFPVIDICNSHCQMCKIWENKKSDDISPESLRIGLKNPLYSEVSGVGLNGGEPTLRKDLGELASVLFEELPKLNGISLITNAYNFQEVIARIEDVGKVVAKYNGRFDVMVSLDGYGDVHDRVRGKPGNFERAQHVIDFIKKSPLVHSVRIGCTIIKENVYGLHDLFDYCQRQGLYVKYRLGVPHQRLYTQDVVEPYALSFEEKYHIAEFMEGLIQHYESSAHQIYFYRSLIGQMLHNAPRRAGCDWKHRGATITSKGELLFCAVQSKSLGLIQKQDSQKIYFDNKKHLDDIIRTKCDSCHHDYVGLPPRREYLKQFSGLVLGKLRLQGPVRNVVRGILSSKLVGKARYKKRFEAFRSLPDHAPAAPFAGTVPKVLICGWYGTETLGDKAILGGVIDSLRRSLGEIDIILVALFPYISRMTRSQMPELNGVEIVDAREGVQRVALTDLVVFGGGPLMALNELVEMECIFERAKRHQVPRLIAGCGVGPFGEPWHNESLRNILSMASLRIYRDQKSKDAAIGIGIDGADDLVGEDPAFSWLAQQRPNLTSRPPSDRKVVLLGLRDFPYEQYARHLSKEQCLQVKARYELAVLEALKELVVQHPDVSIRPLPMCTNHIGADDRWFYRRLFRSETALRPFLDYSLLDAELAPREYCEAFRGAHVAITMRFHSVVFALGLEVPTVAIDYTLGKGKVHSLVQRFGVPCQSMTELTAEFLIESVNALLDKPTPQATGFVPEFVNLVVDRLPAIVRPDTGTR